MNTVTISSKYQVVIPEQVRKKLDLTPGQTVHVIAHRGRIEILPVRPAAELRGVLRGLDTSDVRDEVDRL
jgi:AbrB family looped-hinge helix DNA binding protein